jgi:LCP family protein required for cell wall assembly
MQGLVNGLNFTDVISPAAADGNKPADGARDILLVGLDSRTDAQGNPLSPALLNQLQAGVSDGELNTDTLILVHIPNDGSKAVAISLPRDSYVDIPGGYGKHKINSAYARAKNAAAKDLQKQGITDSKQLELQSNQAGAKTLIATVEKLTGSTIDNYAAINLLGFSDITNAIGGVDVCLKKDVKDSYSGADFKAGKQTLSGPSALAFVRQRHGLPRGDLDRVVRQQVFMASLANKVLSAGTLTDPGKLSSLSDAIKKSVVLNQGWDIFGFAQQLKGLTGGQLEFRTIPVVNIDYNTPEDGSAIQIDPAQVHQFIQGLTGPASAPPQAPPTSNAANSAITVDVHNGAGKSGLAAGVLQSLSTNGFTAGTTANSSTRKVSLIQYAAGQQAAAQSVAAALGGKIAVKQDSSVTPGRISVLLGTDYNGPTSTPKTSQPSAPATTGSGASSSSTPPPADDAPITADGVTCVN